MKHLIEKTLKELGINARVKDVQVTPQVTRYLVDPVVNGRRVTVRKIRAVADDIATALGRYPVRVIPCPKDKAIGIEVPNTNRQYVHLNDVMRKPVYYRQVGSGLKVALGVDENGQPVILDLADAPHTLIAGATGSGKSVCMNVIVTCLTTVYTPEQVKLILVDPKMVEFEQFADLLHLAHPIVNDARLASLLLSMSIGEMTYRYRLFQENKVKNLDEYNRVIGKSLQRVVIIIDEMADLMMTLGKEIEPKLVKIAQLGRAAGIHLVLATQRPVVGVVTGLIKANVPARIAFRVNSGIDSRVILDELGAELLLGKGDGIVKDSTGKQVRFQGCYT